jgi:hypothetical protein
MHSAQPGETWYRRILLLFAAVAALGLMCNFAMLLWAQNEFSAAESVVGTQALMLARQGTLYYDIHHYPYTICAYMPLYYFLEAGFHRLGFETVTAGRLISFASAARHYHPRVAPADPLHARPLVCPHRRLTGRLGRCSVVLGHHRPSGYSGGFPGRARLLSVLAPCRRGPPHAAMGGPLRRPGDLHETDHDCLSYRDFHSPVDGKPEAGAPVCDCVRRCPAVRGPAHQHAPARSLSQQHGAGKPESDGAGKIQPASPIPAGCLRRSDPDCGSRREAPVAFAGPRAPGLPRRRPHRTGAHCVQNRIRPELSR